MYSNIHLSFNNILVSICINLLLLHVIWIIIYNLWILCYTKFNCFFLAYAMQYICVIDCCIHQLSWTELVMVFVSYSYFNKTMCPNDGNSPIFLLIVEISIVLINIKLLKIFHHNYPIFSHLFYENLILSLYWTTLPWLKLSVPIISW